MRVKKGDRVVVIAGRDKGLVGKVIAAYPTPGQGPRRGCQRPARSTRRSVRPPRGAKTGGITHEEAPIHVSNVMLAVDVDGKTVGTRVGYRYNLRRGEERSSSRSGRRSGPVRTSDQPPQPRLRSLPRLKQRYREEIITKLRDEFAFGNVMQAPTVNQGDRQHGRRRGGP